MAERGAYVVALVESFSMFLSSLSISDKCYFI
jgi:hypothetical protein